MEMFVVSPERDVTLPAHMFNFPLQEHAAERVVSGSTGKVYRDGWAVELSTCHPDTNIVSLINKGKLLMREAEYRIPAGLKFSLTPAMKVDLQQVKAVPPDLRVFGCKPSWNAYKGVEEGVFVDPNTHPFRCVGCHFHLSLDPQEAKQHPEITFSRFPHAQLAKLFDLYLALPLMWMFPSSALKERRRFYGLAGDYRLPQGENTSYIEYRSLQSEVWCHPLVAYYFYTTARAVWLNAPKLWERWDSGKEPLLREVLNNVDMSKAQELMAPVHRFWTKVWGSTGDLYHLDRKVQSGKINRHALATEFSISEVAEARKLVKG